MRPGEVTIEAEVSHLQVGLDDPTSPLATAAPCVEVCAGEDPRFVGGPPSPIESSDGNPIVV